jgi:hypothetical protein
VYGGGKTIKLGTNRVVSKNDSASPSLSGIAVAVYEYKSTKDGEHTIHIGDRVTIMSRSSQMWSVEKDGVLGLVPQSCLLEISEAEDMTSERFKETVPSKGIALSVYRKVGPNELNIEEGDSILVFKKYQHWLLAEKDGIRGWIPSSHVSMERRSKEDFEQIRSPMSPKGNSY